MLCALIASSADGTRRRRAAPLSCLLLHRSTLCPAGAPMRGQLALVTPVTASTRPAIQLSPGADAPATVLLRGCWAAHLRLIPANSLKLRSPGLTSLCSGQEGKQHQRHCESTHVSCLQTQPARNGSRKAVHKVSLGRCSGLHSDRVSGQAAADVRQDGLPHQPSTGEPAERRVPGPPDDADGWMAECPMQQAD